MINRGRPHVRLGCFLLATLLLLPFPFWINSSKIFVQASSFITICTILAGGTIWLGSILGLAFAVCGNGEKPVGPAQKAAYLDNHLAKLTESGEVPSKVFNGRITKALIDPENRKRMEDMYPSFAGKQLEDYDLLKRADCLAFGKEILVGIK